MALFNEEIKGRLLFALPKKGRLYEKTLELLAGADIQFTRSHRLDVCLVRNLPMALVFLPAADIPRFVGEGNVDLGITGQDMVAESLNSSPSGPSLVKEVLPLGFGKCKLQVQVPEKGPFKKVEDLVGKKVVTSFDVLAGKYFGELDRKLGLVKEGEEGGGKDGKGTVIEYIGGSVEAACALGLADGIVDLVESGETMRAAGLHPIETILTSEAVLIQRSSPASSSPLTSQPVSTPSVNNTNNSSLFDREALIALIKSRIAGVIAAGKYVLCNYNIQRGKLPQATAITPGRRAPTVSPLDETDWVAVSAMVERSNVAKTMDELERIGASDILIVNISNCRV